MGVDVFKYEPPKSKIDEFITKMTMRDFCAKMGYKGNVANILKSFLSNKKMSHREWVEFTVRIKF